MKRLLLAAMLAAPALMTAQHLPPYVPVSPVLASRSALYAQPLATMKPGWSGWIVTDYTNAIEQRSSSDNRSMLLDAELLQVDLWARRSLGEKNFLIVNLPLRGGYDGHLDGFLNWYHDLIGIPVPARNHRPENRFGWEVELPGKTFSRNRPGSFIGDVRLGVGRQLGSAQLTATVTLPTATTKQDDWGRGTIGTAMSAAMPLYRSSRLALEGSLAAGWTPTHGELAAWQRSWFLGASTGLWWQAIGNQSIFGTLWVQSSNWKGTGFPQMDAMEITLDFGGLIRLGEGWPAIQLGMTEDLLPRGPAVDAGFKLGVQW
jgi:hypothetical protein